MPYMHSIIKIVAQTQSGLQINLAAPDSSSAVLSKRLFTHYILENTVQVLIGFQCLWKCISRCCRDDWLRLDGGSLITPGSRSQVMEKMERRIGGWLAVTLLIIQPGHSGISGWPRPVAGLWLTAKFAFHPITFGQSLWVESRKERITGRGSKTVFPPSGGGAQLQR